MSEWPDDPIAFSPQIFVKTPHGNSSAYTSRSGFIPFDTIYILGFVILHWLGTLCIGRTSILYPLEAINTSPCTL